MKLSIGFSPCPNDTFIFDAMVHGKIDTEGLEFEVFMGDVEELNQKAFNAELAVTKLSYHALGYLLDKYALLNSGSALGQNCGPLLIQRKEGGLNSIDTLSNAKIAIPGKYTTANFLLSLAYPNAKNKIEVLFSDIEEMVLDGEVDAGLIIHENRFTYSERGLEKIRDLGEFWEELSASPIPLGGIVVKRDFPIEIQQKVDRVLRKSVEYAFANPKASGDFVQRHAQEMDPDVMQQHIDLYVNEYSIDLGEKGRSAVTLLFKKAVDLGLIDRFNQNIFV